MGGRASSASGADPRLTLTYFDIQGVGEKVRLALSLGKVPFDDARVQFGEWAELKPKTPYGQLPTLSIDGAAPIAQSDAMLRYAGRLATARGVPLYPDDKLLEVDEAMGLVADLQRDWRMPVYIGIDPTKFGHEPEFKGTDEHQALVKKLRGAFMEKDFPKYMGFLEARLEATGAFLVEGGAPTIADCELVPLLNRFASGGVDYVDAGCVKAHPVVQAYVDRFMALPEVKSYYEAREAAAAAAK